MIASVFIIGLTVTFITLAVTYVGPKTDVMAPIAVIGFLALTFNLVPHLRKRSQLSLAEVKRLLLDEVSKVSKPPLLDGFKEKAAELDINVEEYMANLAKGTIIDQGIKALMEQDYKTAVNLFEDNAKTHLKEAALSWFLGGNAHYFLGEYNEALIDFRKSVSFDPKFAKAWYNWSVTLEALGQHQEAKEKYKKSQEFDINLAEIGSDLSSAKENRQPSQKEIEKCQQALELETAPAKN